MDQNSIALGKSGEYPFNSVLSLFFIIWSGLNK